MHARTTSLIALLTLCCASVAAQETSPYGDAANAPTSLQRTAPVRWPSPSEAEPDASQYGQPEVAYDQRAEPAPYVASSASTSPTAAPPSHFDANVRPAAHTEPVAESPAPLRKTAAPIPIGVKEPALKLPRPDAAVGPGSGKPSLATALGGLGVVLGLFFLVTWGMRRCMPKGAGTLPSGVIEVLGRAPLAGRQQLHLVRLGNKLLLLSAQAGHVEPLAEVTDPAEVDRLAGLCQQQKSGSSTAVFEQALRQFTVEAASSGKRLWGRSRAADEPPSKLTSLGRESRDV